MSGEVKWWSKMLYRLKIEYDAKDGTHTIVDATGPRAALDDELRKLLKRATVVHQIVVILSDEEDDE